MSLSSKVARSLSHQAPRSEDAVHRIETLRAAAKHFAEAIESNVGALMDGSACDRKPSREASLAITNLEQALMWAVKGVVLE